MVLNHKIFFIFIILIATVNPIWSKESTLPNCKNLKMKNNCYAEIKNKYFSYKGEFLNNKPHGYGFMKIFSDPRGNKYNSGSTYEGYWKNGQTHGQGKRRWNDGVVYDGQWLNDQMSGQGKLYDSNGNLVYEGSFKNNRQNGYGICIKNKVSYSCNYVDGKLKSYKKLN